MYITNTRHNKPIDLILLEEKMMDHSKCVLEIEQKTGITGERDRKDGGIAKDHRGDG